MAKSRDSIYNVNSDIRLEDYTSQQRRNNPNPTFKIFFICTLLFIILYYIYKFFAYLGAPDYKLGIANEYIDEKNIQRISKHSEININSKKPVYIRFQWEKNIDTDYIRIQIFKIMESGEKREETVMGRKKPKISNYIYFMGPLDMGKYELEVMDRDDNILKSKIFQVH